MELHPKVEAPHICLLPSSATFGPFGGGGVLGVSVFDRYPSPLPRDLAAARSLRSLSPFLLPPLAVQKAQ